MPELVPPGLGQADKIAPANPAAGADIDYTATLAARYHILALHFHLATDANVATRYTSLQILLGTDTIIQVGDNNLGVINNAAYDFSYYPGAHVYQDTHALIMTYKFSPALYISGKFKITTTTANIQVGDQYSAICIWVARWLEPA